VGPLSASRPRRWLAVIGVPASASLILLAVPGPCTTFNGIEGDAADAGCDLGLPLDFVKRPGSYLCPELLNEQCCQDMPDCDGGCLAGIACVNDCDATRYLTGSCVEGCIQANPGVLAIKGLLTGCFVDAAQLCEWVSLKRPPDQ
jgi:hypothetical protein